MSGRVSAETSHGGHHLFVLSQRRNPTSTDQRFDPGGHLEPDAGQLFECASPIPGHDVFQWPVESQNGLGCAAISLDAIKVCLLTFEVMSHPQQSISNG